MAELTITGSIESDGGSTVETWEYKVGNSIAALAAAPWLEFPGVTGNELYFTFDNLAAGSDYYFQIRTINGVGPSVPSDVFHGRTRSDSAPAKPALEIVPYTDRPQLALKATADDRGSQILKWEYKSGIGEEAGVDLQALLPAVEIPNSSVSSMFLDLSGLEPNTPYWAIVRAINETGESEWSDLASGLVPKVVPYRPDVILSVEDSVIDARITINATSANDGSEPITKWETRHIPVTPGGAEIEEATWSEVSGASGLSMTHTITGLRENQAYEIEVRATNSIGRSQASLTSSIFTSDLPTTPEIPSFTLAPITDGYGLSLTAAVSSDGGDAITRWEYRFATTSAGVASATWLEVQGATGDSITNALIGTAAGNAMDDDTLYYVQVRAINRVGASEASSIMSETTTDLIERPEAPSLAATATYTATQMTVTLAGTVSDNGGSAVTRWEYRTATTSAGLASAAWTIITGASGNSLSTTLAAAARRDRHYQVRAMNGIGNSPASNEALVPGIIAPSKPTLTAATDATDGHHQINLTAAVTDNGGAAISEWQYKVATSVAGLGSADWVDTGETGNSLTAFGVENLSLSTTYQFQVRAYNGEQYSPASEPASAATTAAEKPDKPTLTMTAGEGSITFAGAVASDNGAAVTSWQYRYATTTALLASAAWVTATGQSGNTASITVTSLAGETTFYGQVRAVNSVGASDASSTANATTPVGVSAPGAPTRPSGSISGRFVFLSAQTSRVSEDGGSPITGWEYRFAKASDGVSGASWNSIDYNLLRNIRFDPLYWDTGLFNGYWFDIPAAQAEANTNYEFQIRAVNRGGGGAASPTLTLRTGSSVANIWRMFPAFIEALSPTSIKATSYPISEGDTPLSSITFYTVRPSGNFSIRNKSVGSFSGTNPVEFTLTESEFNNAPIHAQFIPDGEFGGAGNAYGQTPASGAAAVPSMGSISATTENLFGGGIGIRIRINNFSTTASQIGYRVRFASTQAGLADATWYVRREYTRNLSQSGTKNKPINLPAAFQAAGTWHVEFQVRNLKGYSSSATTTYTIASGDPGGASGFSEEGDPPPLDQSPRSQTDTAPTFRLTEGDGSISIDWTEPPAERIRDWPFGTIEGYNESWSADDSTFYESEMMDMTTARVVKAKIGYPDLFAPENAASFASESEVELTLLHGTAQNNLTATVVNRNVETTVTARYLKARIHLKKTANRALANMTLSVEDAS